MLTKNKLRNVLVRLQEDADWFDSMSEACESAIEKGNVADEDMESFLSQIISYKAKAEGTRFAISIIKLNLL